MAMLRLDVLGPVQTEKRESTSPELGSWAIFLFQAPVAMT
jgi:hypothetical protein